MSAGVAAPPALGRVQALAAEILVIARESGAQELAAGLDADIARSRGGGPAQLVVAGEAKRGKSSLINALLGRPGLSPVGVDVATNTYVAIRHGADERVRVVREDGASEEHPGCELAPWASVDGNPDNEKGVRSVDVSVPHPLLADGLVLIDTPGVGGLVTGHAAVTLAALAAADGLVFVMEAGAELSAPELQFLQRASERIDTVLLVLTKCDAHADWRRVLDRDVELLTAHAPRFAGIPILPVSSRMKRLADDAARAGDAELARELGEESGFSALEAAIRRDVLGGGHTIRARNLARGAISALGVLERSERLVAADPAGDPEAAREFEAARTRLQEFSRARQTARTRLGDEVTLLGQRLNRDFSRALSALSADLEDRLLDDDDLVELDAALRVVVADLNTRLWAELAVVAEQLSRELAVALGVEPDAIVPEFELMDPDDPAKTPQTLPQRLIGGLPPLTSGWHLGSIATTIIGGSMFALVPVAVGGVITGLSLLVMRETRERQERLRDVRRLLDRARIEVPPVLAEQVIEARRALEVDFDEAAQARERQLGAAQQRAQQAQQLDQQSRLRARATAEGRLEAIRRLRTALDVLSRELRSAPAPG